MSMLYLIRHGATEANEKQLYCGATDLPLSAGGVAALETLRDTKQYPPLSGLRVFTSGMRRAEMTLETLYGSVRHEALPGLREMSFGTFEMRSYEELRSRPEYVAWISGDNRANRAPGGESGLDMDARVAEALAVLLGCGGGALAVLHGGPIAAAMARLFPGERRNRYEWQPKNGCGWAVDTARGTFAPLPWEAQG